MSTVVKDLGAVSAYAYAVEKGYTGTEAEFAELMADYAEVGQTAVTAAQTATTKASEAATSATTATNKASEATTAATTAINKAAEAQADADAAALDASQALSAASTATTKATEATTAAATAVSAKDDAVSANTAAQSAKTAAQTAQTGAETAAASVQESAEQIATNTDDIAQLKNTLTDVNAELADLRVGADGTTYNSAGAAVRGQISDLNEKLTQVSDIISIGGNLIPYAVEKINASKFYYLNNGDLSLSASGSYDAYKIRIDEPTKTVYFKKTPYVFVINESGAVLYGTNNSVIGSIDLSALTAPKYICYSHQKERTGDLFVSYDYENHLYLNSIKKSDTKRYSRYVKNITPSSVTMVMNDGNYNAVRQGIVITGKADLSSTFVYAELGLMKYDSTTRVAWIAVNSTTLVYHLPDGTQVTASHGITIENNVQLTIKVNTKNQITAEVVSNGNKFSKTWVYDNLYSCTPYFEVDGQTTQGTLTWECVDICKNIWLFGDSYMTYDQTRWPYNLEADGYAKNCLIDQFSGCNSASGIISLLSLVRLNRPKYVIWGLGMNDGGDSSDSPNSTWLEKVQEFLRICASYEITPILCTIPTISTVDNEQKNTWIRSSGYRYIDFAKAVGAQSDGTWFSGMLAQDGVHPSVTGGMALYYQVLADFPEIMIDNMSM